MTSRPALVALDWGTSSLRAFLVGRGGTVLERRATARGILNVPGGDFERVFDSTVGGWLAAHPALPVLASGMIGSRQGWHEAAYALCPAGAAELARQLLPVARKGGGRLRIVPGVARDVPGEAPDVMRGEETQVLGCLASDTPEPARIFVLPGTHSKWVVVEDGRLTWFATFMTGELFAVLKNHSILGRLMEGDGDDPASFARGLALAAEQAPASGGLLHKLFTTRSLGLFDRLPVTGAAAYLSGLLIGSELADACASIAVRLGAAPCEVTVIGEPALARLYHKALASRSIESRLAPADAVVQGLLRLADAAGLLSQSADA